MSQFDQFSGKYESTVSEATKLFGEEYDYFAQQKVRQLGRCLKSISTGTNGPLNILDVGCGTCGVQSNLGLLDVPHRSFGIDLSFELLKTGKTQYPGAALAHADATKLPFKSSTLDVVYFAVVIHHTPPNLREAVFREVHRVLKPGGFVAVFEHNPYNPATQWVVKHTPLDADAVLASMREISGQLRSCGFKILRRAYTTFFPRALKFLRPLEERLGWLPLGGQYYVFGRRA